MDISAFESSAVTSTLAQFSRGEFHDRDFAAFRKFGKMAISTILDVGANRGQSLASLRAVFPSAHVHSFEANPLYFPVLDQVAASLPGHTTVHPYGLGRTSGQLTLFVPWVGQEPYLEESSTVLEYFQKPWVVQKYQERGGLSLRQVQVDIRKGDDLALMPQIIKIDVEGAELAVVEGLASTIAASSPVLMAENSDWHRVTAALGELSYKPYQYDPIADRLEPLQGATTNTFYLLDRHFESLK